MALGGGPRRTHPARLVPLAVAVALVVLASGCRILTTPTQGFQVIPDVPVAHRKVLLIGDSLLRQPSLAFGSSLEPAGAEVLIEATNTGGLVSGPVHWDQRAKELIFAFQPDIAVIGFHGSFAAPYWPPYAPTAAAGTPEYDAWVAAQPGTAEFAQRNLDAVLALTKVFTDNGVRVYWVQPLPFPPQYGSPSPPQKLWGQWVPALASASPGTRTISANASISGPGGAWIDHMVFCGQDRYIRSTAWDGGVHLTTDGAGRYGRALARALASAEGWPAPIANCGD